MKTKRVRLATEYDPTIAFRLPLEHREAIVREAGKRHLKESDVLREIVREWVSRKHGVSASASEVDAL